MHEPATKSAKLFLLLSIKMRSFVTFSSVFVLWSPFFWEDDKGLKAKKEEENGLLVWRRVGDKIRQKLYYPVLYSITFFWFIPKNAMANPFNGCLYVCYWNLSLRLGGHNSDLRQTIKHFEGFWEWRKEHCKADRCGMQHHRHSCKP